MRTFILFFISTFIFFSCKEKNEQAVSSYQETETIDSIWFKSTEINHHSDPSELEKYLIEQDLVDIKTIDSTIRVDLKYSSSDNFLGVDVYGDFNKCYLQKDVAYKLAEAQKYLKQKFPYYNIIVYDAVRPRHIQQIMWDTIKVNAAERPKYLSNPKFGSLHNFGAAVDVSIVNNEGMELDMGTEYDYFGELAYPELENKMIQEEKLSFRQILNREILREAMQSAGFFNIQTEWWHFNSCYRNEAIKKYKLIE